MLFRNSYNTQAFEFTCHLDPCFLSSLLYSRLLGEIWRKADIDEKKPFLEREEKERQVYRAKIASWKADQKLATAMASFTASPRANTTIAYYQPEMREEPGNSHEKFGTESTSRRDDAASFMKEEASFANYGKSKSH